MLYPSLFDSFFAPTRVIVVSEERLKQAEVNAAQERIEAVDARINDLTKYRVQLEDDLKKLSPPKEPQSLEEALTGTDCDV